MEFQSFRKQKNGNLLSMKNHGAPRLDRWTIHRIVYSVTDYQYSLNSSGYYLKVNNSTTVPASYFVIMCNQLGISSENIVDT